jgi:hypothetical protein
MARILDGDEPLDEQFDLSALECPKCSGNCVEILKYPHNQRARALMRGQDPARSGVKWFGSTGGKARCEVCNVTFGIAIEPEEPTP